jgi:hypothetical protein
MIGIIIFTVRNKSNNINLTDESHCLSKLKKGKFKTKKSKTSSKKDADKDIDEMEAKFKRHSLRKWF